MTQNELRTKISGAVDDMNLEESKAAKESTIGVRGKTDVAHVKRENVMFMFGCRPSLGVLSETKMVKDFTDCVVSRLDHPTLSVEFPKVIE